jgi:hypothetical protein
MELHVSCSTAMPTLPLFPLLNLLTGQSIRELQRTKLDYGFSP